jgi:phosphoesterase RecJ-like protein
VNGIDEAVRMVQDGQRFLVACHRRPDADAYGSALAFAAILLELGKDVTLYVPDDLSITLHYLEGYVPRVRELPADASFDSAWVMDTAAKTLLPDGLPGPEVRGPLIVVDHHAAHDDVGDLKLRDTDACATGEVIAELSRALGVWPVPRAAATPLYAAIVADTGGFRYPSTKARTLRLGADLLEAGADPWEAAYELFEGWEEPRMKLLAAILDTLELSACGRLAVLRVTRAMLAEVGANDDMVEGMVNYGRMLRGVEVAALLWEWPRDPDLGDGLDTKVSLRSRGSADISLIAVALGGGGHRNAAGAQCSEDFDTVRVRVEREALAILGPVSASTPPAASAGATTPLARG